MASHSLAFAHSVSTGQQHYASMEVWSIVSQQVGLKMNMDKTKIMSNVHVTPVPVIVGNDALEVVDHYVYLGQVVQLGSPTSTKRSPEESNSDGQRSGNFILTTSFVSGLPFTSISSIASLKSSAESLSNEDSLPISPAIPITVSHCWAKASPLDFHISLSRAIFGHSLNSASRWYGNNSCKVMQNSQEAWDALSSAYEDKGLGRRISLERKLYRYCLDDFDSNIEMYINAVMSTVQDLADIGKIMEDASIAAILLGGLSPQYAPLVMALENSNIDITVDLIKTKLLNELNKPAIDNPGTALRTRMNQNKPSTSKSKKPIVCYDCMEPGDKRPDCPIKRTRRRDPFKLWHRRLGHLCRIGMDQLRKGHAVGVDYSEVDKEPCIPCIEGDDKEHRYPGFDELNKPRIH
ncbi:hypothetical protein MSG28_014946 [Choristoneura fumiferana]|uniref:Uncharacterized protein n=1 Tax=Choristoneura fumiferana TaxID=7141 RepID=A0ACC0KYD0_CHOFU|nr:hypothetical protein MSG28_014946 [Choristoneura fumiferana]